MQRVCIHVSQCVPFYHKQVMLSLYFCCSVNAAIKILEYFTLRLIVENKIVQNKADIVTVMIIANLYIIPSPMSLKSQN